MLLRCYDILKLAVFLPTSCAVVVYFVAKQALQAIV